MALGTLIKKQLDAQGRSVTWLSRQTGISDNTLYAIIKRDSDNIPTDSLKKICGAFPVDTLSFISTAIELSQSENDSKAYGILCSKLMDVLNDSLSEFKSALAKAEHDKAIYIHTHDKDQNDNYEKELQKYDFFIDINRQAIEQLQQKYAEAQYLKMHEPIDKTLQDNESGATINAIGVLDLTSDEIQEMLTFKEFLKFKRLNNGK